MNKWIEELSKCTCWYPDMKAREKLTCECEECDHECHSKKFAAVHASVLSHFNQERSLFSRHHLKVNCAAAFAERRGLCAA